MCVYSLLEVTGRRKSVRASETTHLVPSSNREILRQKRIYRIYIIARQVSLLLHRCPFSSSSFFLLFGPTPSCSFVWLSLIPRTFSTRILNAHTLFFLASVSLLLTLSLSLSPSRARAQWFRFLTLKIIFLVPFTLKKTFFSGPFFFLKISTLSRISFARFALRLSLC